MSFDKPLVLTFADFRRQLGVYPMLGLRFKLPTGSLTPIHLHLTEVARVEKKFIDCGGTIRTQVSARLQLWAADDTDHRVNVTKCLEILNRGTDLLGSTDLPLEVECDLPFLTAFPVLGTVIEDGNVVVLLGTIKADCLAPDVCIPKKCTPGGGCC